MLTNRIQLRRGLLAAAALSSVLLITGLGSPASATALTAPPRLSTSSLAGLLGSPSSMGVPPAASRVTSAETYSGSARRRDGECSPPYGWLTTQGKWIVEAKDPSCHIRLAGVTWFGMQSDTYALAGLDYEPYQFILNEVADEGFNSVRIPLSDWFVSKSACTIINHKKWLRAANPGLPSNLRPLQLLDLVINYAASLNLMVILDNHFTTAVPASGTPPSGFNAKSSARDATCHPVNGEAGWVDDWKTLTERYADQPDVIGFDLRNEPHTQWNPKLRWSLKAYLTEGATWGPCTHKLCGKLSHLWKKKSDWVAQAEAAGDAVLSINPHLLMFVEGVQLYPNPRAKSGAYSYWWGAILRGVAVDPVKFVVSTPTGKQLVTNQLVYSPHVWGPWKCCDPDGEFVNMTLTSLSNNYWANWAYIPASANPAIQAPIWIGEFNTCNAAMKAEKGTNLGRIKPAGACVNSTKSGSEGLWFHLFIQYLQKNPWISWSYYPLNGTTEKNGQSNNSILGCPRGTDWAHGCNPWAQPRLPAILTALQTVQQP